MRPNVLLIVFDAARADHFEPYGAPLGSTPVVARLADEGAAQDAYASACWTVPSHASMFSGLLPRAAGMIRAPQGTPPSCKPVMESLAPRLLANVFRGNGYDTRAISANFWLSPESGFDTGFNQFVSVLPDRDRDPMAPTVAGRLKSDMQAIRAGGDDGASAAFKTLQAWNTEPRSKPFLWFVNLVEAHSPYMPPRPHNPLGPLARLRANREARAFLSMDAVWKACAGAEVPRTALARMKKLYAGSISYLDTWLGRVVESLASVGVLDETIIVVTADHGENLGEDGLMGHAFSLDDRLLQVPLVVRGADLATAGPVGPVSLASLPLRLANATALEDHPWRETDLPGQGVVVAEFDPPRGADSIDATERAAVAWGLPPEQSAKLRARLTSATDGRFKLTRRDDAEILIDTTTDPGERKPLAAEALSPGALGALRSAIDFRADLPTPEIRAEGRRADAAEVAELEQRMRALGYL